MQLAHADDIQTYSRGEAFVLCRDWLNRFNDMGYGGLINVSFIFDLSHQLFFTDPIVSIFYEFT
jgi:hypothetical protein